MMFIMNEGNLSHPCTCNSLFYLIVVYIYVYMPGCSSVEEVRVIIPQIVSPVLLLMYNVWQINVLSLMHEHLPFPLLYVVCYY